MTAPPAHQFESHGGGRGAGVSRPVIVLAVTGTILLALGAFWLSFTTLQDLAVLSGIPAGQAWVWPLIVDGVILEATISVVALRNSAPAARRFAWLLLAAGAGVSVAANVTHAILGSDTRVPALIAAVVASVPPLVLLAMTHLTVELTRNATPPATVPHRAAQPSAVQDRAEPVESLDATPVIAELVPPDSSGGSGSVAGTTAASVPRTPAAAPAASGEDASVSREEARMRAVVLHAEGVPKRQIAAELGVHPTTVGRWVNVPEGGQDGAPS